MTVVRTKPTAAKPLPLRKSERLEETRRMEIVPGIRFMDGVSERVPVMIGTGIEVWEIVGPYKGLDGDLEELYDAFDWLSKEQIDAALAYYRLFPTEVDERLAEEAWLDPDAGNVTYPIQF